MGFCNVWKFTCTEKKQTDYVVNTGSGQTLQQASKISGSAEIMKSQATEPIVVYLLLPFLSLMLFSHSSFKKIVS
jgi:hypothetical protein